MTALEMFTFPPTGRRVRGAVVNGTTWFVGKDLATGLEYANPREAVRTHVPAAHRGGRDSLPLGELGLDPQTVMVTEAGMYRLIMRANTAVAEQFQEWVTADVLPTLRRTGHYDMDLVPADPLDALELQTKRTAQAIALARVERQRALEAEGGDGLTLRAFHKKHFSDVRETTFFGVLYDKGLLIDQLGKGTRRADGTVRNGAQHRHPTYLGKPYFYLHTTTNDRGRRFENTRVRPGEPELELRAYLVKAGLTANTSTDLELAR